MKWVFWILLLGNALMFGYFNLQDAPVSATQLQSHQPIKAEKIKILSPEEIAKLPLKAAKSEASVDASASLTMQSNSGVTSTLQAACYEWGSFSVSAMAKAKNVLAKYSLQSTVKPESNPEGQRYWVYIPSRATMELAQQKVAELKAHGVQESFIMQEPQWRYAISLGVFKDEQLASKLLEELRAKGVVSAIKGVRKLEKDQSVLLINNMSADTAAELQKMKQDFPESELKQVACQ